MARIKRSLHHRAAATPLDAVVATVEAYLESARKRGVATALLLVDINNFHVISNGLGRSFGDAVLGLVAKRLELSVQNLGKVHPFGGDKFLVLVAEHTSASSVDTTAIAARLVNAIRMPLHVEGDDGPPLVVSACIGSVVDDGETPDELLRCAEIALHEAKAKGLQNHVRFEPAMREAAEAQAQLERDLREALDTERLFLVYLPSIDIASNRVTGAEALLRWQHPERGVVFARDFVPLLERSGTIIDIGSWVLQEACMQAAAWQRRKNGVAVRVNLSPSQIRADVLLGDLRDALEISRLDPSLLVLEIAESTIVEDSSDIAERLNEFKALGVRIAVDNFGAAYATLGQLQHLPLDSVTIDRQLIADLGKQDTGTTLVRTLVGIAGGLGLETVAEGVEDELQLEELRDAGCSGALGYLFSEPVDSEAMDKLFEDGEALTPGARRARPAAGT